jgi:sugar phosphate permease
MTIDAMAREHKTAAAVPALLIAAIVVIVIVIIKEQRLLLIIVIVLAVVYWLQSCGAQLCFSSSIRLLQHNPSLHLSHTQTNTPVRTHTP